MTSQAFLSGKVGEAFARNHSRSQNAGQLLAVLPAGSRRRSAWVFCADEQFLKANAVHIMLHEGVCSVVIIARHSLDGSDFGWFQSASALAFKPHSI